MDNIQFSEYGEFLGELPKECVDDCSHSGDCYNDVLYWLEELNFNVPENLARKYLKEFGAWDDLDDCSQDLLNQRVLWIACNEISEMGEWLGLIH